MGNSRPQKPWRLNCPEGFSATIITIILHDSTGPYAVHVEQLQYLSIIANSHMEHRLTWLPHTDTQGPLEPQLVEYEWVNSLAGGLELPKAAVKNVIHPMWQTPELYKSTSNLYSNFGTMFLHFTHALLPTLLIIKTPPNSIISIIPVYF